ncbi:hypothetical protein V501_05468 [Pseudogymnoascus sp. VKM F-4519 (FW-2642)]|nr:hypothetical protein V501_05468 [Pseudogymnoascus sp. VKM F-4519 (FW-2642)]
MAPRPPISNRPLPQVRGTPMNPGALTTQLTTHGTAVASSIETQTMSNPGQHVQVQRALPSNNGSRPSTPPSSANSTAITDVAEQMRSIMESLERQPPTAENRAQAAIMARNLAELREKMDAAASAAQPRLSADAPEFTPSPSQERGRQGAPSAGNERGAVGGGNPLNQGEMVVPTFTFTSESPGQPQQQYTQEEVRTQIAAIYGSSAQNNVSQLPVVNGSAMASFHGHMEPITINPVTGRPRTPLSHLTAISNNARRRSQERAEREAAVSQAQLDQIIQQNLAQEQQMQQAQQLQQAQQAQQVQAQQMQAQQFQQAQQAQQAQAEAQAQAQQAQAQQLQQAQAQALQAYQARQAHQGQQPPQPLQMPQPHHQPHHFQGQQPSNGQIFNQIQQNLQFAPQQPQQQYPFSMNDISYGQSNHSHMHPQQQMGNDLAFNNKQDFSQGPPVGPFIPQNYEYPSMGQFSAQPATQQHQNIPFNNVNPLPAQPETQNGVPLTHTADAPIPTGPNNDNVTTNPTMMTKFTDTPSQIHSRPAVDGSSDDVAGYFPSAYELTGKWHTLSATMRTPPPQMVQQQNGGDPDNEGSGPSNGANSGMTGNGNGNGNGNGSMSLPTAKSPRNGAIADVNGNGNGNGGTTLSIAKRTYDQNGKTHSRGPSQDNSTTHKNGNTRAQSASHTWRSHTHTISGDFTTLRRNAGHLDLLGSPAFPVSASEYAGLRADTLAEKQARLTAQLGEMMKMKKEQQRVGEAMMGKALYGYSAVLAEKEDVWSVNGSTGAGYPSVAEMKREHALAVSETGSSPGRFFPRPKGMVASVQQGYMEVREPDLVLTNMPREDWSVKSVERARAWHYEHAWGEIVAKASKEAAQKVNQIPTNDSEWLVGRGLLDRLV